MFDLCTTWSWSHELVPGLISFGGPPSCRLLVRVFLKSYGWELFVSWCYKVFNDASQFVGPIILKVQQPMHTPYPCTLAWYCLDIS